MAHVTMNQYLQQVDEALQQGRGRKAAELLSCKHAHSASARLQVEDPELAVQRVMDAPWDEVVCQHLRCLYHMNNYEFVEAYKEQAVLVQVFTKILQSLKEENWALPIMYTACLDLRLFASQADVQLSKKGKGKPGETLEKAAELLMGCFRVCASDNRSSLDNSKRRGMLNLVNQLFKIYFKVNKLHLCKPLIRAIESSALKDHFSISQVVTYRYYVGQKAMFDSDFKNGAAVQKKFKYLKDTYGRIKMQLIKGMKSGNGAKDIKDVKWKYFTQMTQLMEPSSEEPVVCSNITFTNSQRQPAEMEEGVLAAFEVVSENDSDGFMEDIEGTRSGLLQCGSPEGEVDGYESPGPVQMSTGLQLRPSPAAERVARPRKVPRLSKKAQSCPETAEKTLPSTVAAACLTHLHTLRNETLQRNDHVHYSCMALAEQIRTLPPIKRQEVIFQMQSLVHNKVMEALTEGGV